MDGEVASFRRERLDLVQPRAATREGIDAAALVAAVEADGGGVAGGGHHPLRGWIFAVVKDCSEVELGVPGDAGGAGAAEDAVAQNLGDGGAFGSIGSDEDGDGDRTRRGEAWGVEHLDDGAVPGGRLAAEEGAEGG